VKRPEDRISSGGVGGVGVGVDLSARERMRQRIYRIIDCKLVSVSPLACIRALQTEQTFRLHFSEARTIAGAPASFASSIVRARSPRALAHPIPPPRCPSRTPLARNLYLPPFPTCCVINQKQNVRDTIRSAHCPRPDKSCRKNGTRAPRASGRALETPAVISANKARSAGRYGAGNRWDCTPGDSEVEPIDGSAATNGNDQPRVGSFCLPLPPRPREADYDSPSRLRFPGNPLQILPPPLLGRSIASRRALVDARG